MATSAEKENTPASYEQRWRDEIAWLTQQGASPETLQLAEQNAQQARKIDEVENKVGDLLENKLGVSLKFRSQNEFTRALTIMADEQIAGLVLEEFTIIVPRSRVSLFADLKPEKLAVMAEVGRQEWNLLEAIFGDDLPKILEARKVHRKQQPAS